MTRKMLLHHSQGFVAPRLLAVVFRCPLWGEAEILVDVPGGGNIGLVAVLLKKLPLEHLGSAIGIRWQQRRTLCQIVQNGIGLPQKSAIVQDDDGDSSVGVHALKVCGVGFVGEDVNVNPLMGNANQLHQQLDFVAIPRQHIAENFVHF